MPAEALALSITEIAPILRQLEGRVLKDKSYQRTPVGREVKHFLEALLWEDYPQTTRDNYETTLSRFSLRFADFDSLKDFCSPVGTQYIRDFLSFEWGDASPSTKRNRGSCIRSFFSWAVGEGKCPYSPATNIHLPKARGTVRVAHPRSTRRKLIEGQDNLRDECALGLYVRKGLRKNDVRLLQIRDIDLTRNVLILRHRKGGHEMILPLEASDLRETLYLHIQGDERQPSEYLLYPKKDRSRPMDSSSVHRWFKKCLAQAGIADMPLHELRHSAGDEAWRETGDIVAAQMLLGHRSLEHTRRYLHPTENDLRVALRVVDERWREEK